MISAYLTKEDQDKVAEALKDAICAAGMMVQGDVDRAMNDFNSKKQEA